MKLILKIIISISILVIMGCANNDDTVDEYVPTNNGSNTTQKIKMVVYFCSDIQNDPHCTDYVQTVPNATIQLFASQADMINGEPIVAQRTTGADGKAEFALSGNRYYIATTSNRGYDERIETIPSGGIAYYDVYFF